MLRTVGYIVMLAVTAAAAAEPVQVTLSPNQVHTHHTPYAGLGISDDHVIGFTSGSAFFYLKEGLVQDFSYGNIGTVIDGGAGRVPNLQRLELDNSGRVRNVRNHDNWILNNLSLSAYSPLAVSSVFAIDGIDYFAIIDGNDSKIKIVDFSGNVTPTPVVLSDHSDYWFGIPDVDSGKFVYESGLEVYFNPNMKRSFEALRFLVTSNPAFERDNARLGDFGWDNRLDILAELSNPGRHGTFEDVTIDASAERLYVVTGGGRLFEVDYRPVGLVSLGCFAQMADQWGWQGAPGGVSGDVTGPEGVPDGWVDVYDLAALLDCWLSCTTYQMGMY